MRQYCVAYQRAVPVRMLIMIVLDGHTIRQVHAATDQYTETTINAPLVIYRP
jgi:hypothetical protein